MFIIFIEALLIVLALSADSFVTGFAYGANRIKIPSPSAAVITLICGAFLAVSMHAGAFLGRFVPDALSSAVCFVILLLLGSSRVFDSTIKMYIKKHGAFVKNYSFSFFSLGLLLSVYADPASADSDKSNVLSPKEAIALSVALSLDSLAVGFGAGMTGTNPLLAVSLSLVVVLFSLRLGDFLGGKLAARSRRDWSWIGGVLLIALAVLKVF